MPIFKEEKIRRRKEEMEEERGENTKHLAGTREKRPAPLIAH